MRRTLAPLAAAVLALPALTGCSNPCAELAPPTAAERQVVAEAGDELEVEREIDGTDCSLTDDGKWERES